ncbi:hypothetical protein Cgig2_022302 [Carnegiea gigantea]|uniref:AT1G17665-like protein n=1 Tax=Carnegiea gigantea TaxID=171969 RepID=A0A9Q1QIN1_9CARY|nr:hypothetical protein Cgig2_022302 [Carnegiea gigantea]
MESPYPLVVVVLFTLSFISISLLFFSLFTRLRRAEEENEQDPQSKTSISTLKLSLSKLSDKTLNAHQLNSTQFPQSILLELLPSGCDDPIDSGSNSGREDEKESKGKKKKKKKRAKKKQNSSSDMVDLQVGSGREEREGEVGLRNKEELVCLYPFTSSSSATQRKIKRQYDQLVRSHESKGLTLAQVGQFVNCLVDARNELQHKSECIKRKFTITKALLLKADRSSFDRLRQQIYKLELEQKRLEEDAFVYNWLQHQLKLSPAYQKMVELGSCIELKAKPDETTENLDAEQNNISFEEFLAQEKKDAFCYRLDDC